MLLDCAKIMNNTSLALYFRISLAVIYIWFGTLKFFPGLSPAEDLAEKSIVQLTGNLDLQHLGYLTLAAWEVIIGVGFLVGKPIKFWTRLALIHMFFTFTPMVMLPDLCFSQTPFAFTLVGQYIMKNLIFIGAILWLEKSNK